MARRTKPPVSNKNMKYILYLAKWTNSLRETLAEFFPPTFLGYFLFAARKLSTSNICYLKIKSKAK